MPRALREMRLLTAALVTALALPACSGSGGEPAASGGCLDDVLAAYRSLAAPAESLAGGYASITSETTKERPVPERVLVALREARAAARAYEAASRSAERVATTCAEDGGVAARCRVALEGLVSALRSTDAPIARSATRLLRAAAFRAGVERAAAALEQQQVRVEGAAAATASCG